MQTFKLWNALVVPIFCTSLLVPPAPAQASILALMNTQLVAAVQTISAQNACIFFTHDRNGNRTSQSSMTFGGPGNTWGSAVYGCFAWKDPQTALRGGRLQKLERSILRL